jgi:hypothetical protein
MARYPAVPQSLKAELATIEPSKDGDLDYYPCSAVLRTGFTMDRVYIAPEAQYISSRASTLNKIEESSGLGSRMLSRSLRVRHDYQRASQINFTKLANREWAIRFLLSSSRTGPNRHTCNDSSI